jgi:hypothetical protein
MTPYPNSALYTARVVALLATALALVLPPAASASRDAEVSIMDDQLLLGASQPKVDRQMRIFRRLGIDRVRVSAFWANHAPGSRRRKKPKFDAANPNAGYHWEFLDRVVRGALKQKLKVMISISTPAPRWAVRSRVWKPSPRQFGLFAQAVATRYGPYVDHYAMSNEPNQGGWLQPQRQRGRYVSPHHYRAMVQSAYPRIKKADPTSVALLGELASSGSTRAGKRGGVRTPTRPLTFLRMMACRDRRNRPVRRGRCRGFKPVPADALGHHPYSFFSAPSRHSKNRNDAGIGDGRRLLRALDRLTRVGAIKTPGRRRLPVYYTEFGYQTNPPDPFSGIRLGRHNRYLQQAAYIVWRTPRLRGYNQFRLTDGRVGRRRGASAFREFQSGLLFRSRRKKPAYRSFPHPFVIAGSRFWGQVRPGGSHVVTLQYRPRRRGRFFNISIRRTDSRGYFSIRARRRRGYWRYVYSDGPRGASQTLRIR